MRATVSSLLVVILIAIVRTPASAQFSTTASGVAQETRGARLLDRSIHRLDVGRDRQR